MNGNGDHFSRVDASGFRSYLLYLRICSIFIHRSLALGASRFHGFGQPSLSATQRAHGASAASDLLEVAEAEHVG